MAARPPSRLRAGAALGPAAVLAALLSACPGGGNGGGVNSCATFISPGTGDGTPFTLSGSVTYQDLTQDADGFTGGSTFPPVRQATVQVVRCSDSAVLGTGATDDAGAFSVDAAAGNTGARGVYVRVLARIDTTYFDVSVHDQTSSALYALRSGAFDETAVALPLSLSASAADVGAVFNILDQALTDVRYLDAAVPLTAPLPALTMVWEADTTDTTAYHPGAAPWIEVLDQPNAFSPDTDGYDDMVIRHEVGHYLADQVSRDDSPGGNHVAGATDQDARLAWSEGWANFYGGAAGGNPNYVDTFPGRNSLTFSLEGTCTGNGGSTSELGVARALWDGLDGAPGSPPNGDGDGSALGPAPILGAFEDLQGGGGPVEFMRFWNAFRVANAGATAEVEGFRSAAGGCDGVDLFEDDGGADPPGNDLPAGAYTLAAPVPSTVASANLAWDATAVPGPDVDHFRIPLTKDVPYTIITTALSDGADTLVTILDAGGSLLSPPQSNDNWDGATYTNCDATTSCPANGPYPYSSDPEPLSSKLMTFTPSSSADYIIRVTRSPAAPPSAGLFGGYDLVVSR